MMHETRIFKWGIEDTLFQEWIGKSEGISVEKFSDDGIVDQEMFNGFWFPYPRIVIVLKEVHSDKGFSLRSFLYNGARDESGYRNGRPTWAPMQRLLVRLSDAVGKDLKLGENNRAAALRTIAAMNLKKTPGGSIASSQAIAGRTRQDRDFLARQVKLYCDQPTVFVCGGRVVYDLLRKTLELVWNRELACITISGTEYFQIEKGVFAFDAGHHLNRFPKKLDDRFVRAVMALSKNGCDGG